MNKESLQKVLLLEIKNLVQDLEKAVKALPFDEVTYLEGKLNECLEIYQKVFFFEAPNDVWGKRYSSMEFDSCKRREREERR